MSHNRKMDYHLHTVHSFDGRQTMDELCMAMVRQGVEEICLTEHIEPGVPDPTIDLPPVWDVWLREIREMKQRYPQLTIRAGVEIGDNPAMHQEIAEMLRVLPLDFHLLSLHMVNGIDPWEKDKYFPGKTRTQAYREYAEAKAASILMWDDFDSIAHIGYVSRYSPYTGDEKPLYYRDAPDAFDSIFRHIIDHGKCLEVNTCASAGTDNNLPHATLIRRYIELGGENFTFGSDAHDPDRNYMGIEEAKALVRSLGGKYQAAFDRRCMTLYPL